MRVHSSPSPASFHATSSNGRAGHAARTGAAASSRGAKASSTPAAAPANMSQETWAPGMNVRGR